MSDTQTIIEDAARFIARESAHSTDYEETIERLRNEVRSIFAEANATHTYEAYRSRSYRLERMLCELLGLERDVLSQS